MMEILGTIMGLMIFAHSLKIDQPVNDMVGLYVSKSVTDGDDKACVAWWCLLLE